MLFKWGWIITSTLIIILRIDIFNIFRKHKVRILHVYGLSRFFKVFNQHGNNWLSLQMDMPLHLTRKNYIIIKHKKQKIHLLQLPKNKDWYLAEYNLFCWSHRGDRAVENLKTKRFKAEFEPAKTFSTYLNRKLYHRIRYKSKMMFFGR